MFAGALALWVGVPLGWLWVGSQVEGETNSIGTALAVMFVGALISILAIVWALVWLNRKHAERREARGLESYGQTALEGVMTVSAGIAVVGFAGWFFLFSGSSPLPSNLGF
jgi:heme/copper-type cytochrome/quinol oxidase subunit 2